LLLCLFIRTPSWLSLSVVAWKFAASGRACHVSTLTQIAACTWRLRACPLFSHSPLLRGEVQRAHLSYYLATHSRCCLPRTSAAATRCCAGLHTTQTPRITLRYRGRYFLVRLSILGFGAIPTSLLPLGGVVVPFACEYRIHLCHFALSCYIHMHSPQTYRTSSIAI